MANLLTNKELEALKTLRNRLIHTGKMPSVRELMELMNYSSPRSSAVLIEGLIKKGFLKKKSDGSLQLIESESSSNSGELTVDVPLVGSIACGQPILAGENIEALIPVSVRLAPSTNKYFLLRAKGNSMNLKGINDGDLVLVKQQVIAEDGNMVVAVIDDSATVKEYKRTADAVLLIPRSTEAEHKPIIMTNDFLIQGIVVATIPKIE